MLQRQASFAGRLHNWGALLVRVNSTEATSATPGVPVGWDTARPFEDIPGPKPLPLIGNVWRFLPGIGEFYNMEAVSLHRSFMKKYGKIFRFGGIPGHKDMIMLFDPDDTEDLYRNEGIWPIRDATPSFTYYRTVTRKDYFQGAGGGLATQGEEWGKFRSTVNQPMMQPKVAKVYVGPIAQVADDFMDRIALLQDAATGEMPADFINELYKWAFESIVLISLDTRLGCLNGNLEPGSEAQTAINNVHIIFDSIFNMDMKLPIWRYVSTPSWRRFVKSMDYFTEFCLKYINESMKRIKELPADSDHEPSVLERILARDSNPKTAVTMAIDMMMAGVDTTSHSVGFLLYYLAVNPEAQAKLFEEIDAVLPKTSEQPITAEILNDLKYLKACMKESMRINPVALGNMRTTAKDMVFQDYKIPKGTVIIIGHMVMSNESEHFPEPDKFIPERWLKGDSGTATLQDGTHRFVYMPFGFGPRSCIGRRFAELEIGVLVAKIIRKYKVEWNHPPMQVQSKLLNCCKSPLKFKLIER